MKKLMNIFLVLGFLFTVNVFAEQNENTECKDVVQTDTPPQTNTGNGNGTTTTNNTTTKK